MLRFFYLILSLTLGAIALANSQLEEEVYGTWELLDISALSLADSPPAGFGSLKYYFSEDHYLYLLRHDEKLRQDHPRTPFEIKDGILVLTRAESDALLIPFRISKEGRLVLDYGPNEKWTFKKMAGDKAFDREIEPRSVVVIQSENQLTNLDIQYDQGDYSGLTIEKRLIGIWEATHYKNVPRADAPPYGFFNDRWVFTSETLSILQAGNDSSKANALPYKLEGTTCEIGDLKSQVSFNKWGHLILSMGEQSVAFKLISKETDNPKPIPIKIALLSLEGQP